MLACFEVSQPRFDLYWHHHACYELTCIVQGKGRRLVADSQEPFEQGDLVLCGPFLPHSWVSEEANTAPARAWVLHFSTESLAALTPFADAYQIQSLVKQAAFGLCLPKADLAIVQLMQALYQLEGLAQLAHFVQLIHLLLPMQGKKLASANYHLPQQNTITESRLNVAMQYLQKKFTTPDASIAQVANLIHMSKSAFCKFFKRNTGITFSTYLNELRISYACKLLIETERNIEQVAVAAGFESTTYFNRVFLKTKGLQPAKFRMAYKQAI
ncbi:MAG: AraC family transcriptional regulator [Chitinophagaceae bacterium]|nr:AraC family transcriptional regulator [Chitinophagaceae bacterium]